MKKLPLYLLTLIYLTGCGTTTPLQVQVSPLDVQSTAELDRYLYALPQTVLKVDIIYQEQTNFPGPYWEYAEKFLGISDVIRQKSSSWKIKDVLVSQHSELDPGQYYTLDVIEGEFSMDRLDFLFGKGVIVDGSQLLQVEVKGDQPLSTQVGDGANYTDLGIMSNFEQRTETMYKTLVTDTSFVQVPVQRTLVEQKTPSMKAEEAADFLLELRTRRFDLLTGEYESYPDGEAMAATIGKLDQLEKSYLSLFTGKSFSQLRKRSYFIVPNSGVSPSRHRLDMFSGQLGFVPEELMEGLPLELQLEPQGTVVEAGINFGAGSDLSAPNRIPYRLPDMVILKVLLGDEELTEQRISVYQSGALVSTPIN